MRRVSPGEAWGVAEATEEDLAESVRDATAGAFGDVLGDGGGRTEKYNLENPFCRRIFSSSFVLRFLCCLNGVRISTLSPGWPAMMAATTSFTSSFFTSRPETGE